MVGKGNPKQVYDLIIIGTGVSGWGAAMYAGRMQLKTLIIGDVPGGTIMLTDDVENYPGFKKLTGPELAQNIEEHAREYAIDVEDGFVSDIERDEKKKIFTITLKNKNFFKSKTVLLATGTKPRKLGVPGEDAYFGKGVHTCALCDGAFYKEKIIGVVGGSDSAAKEALLLTQWGKKVYIIYRGDQIHPEPVNMTRIQKKIKEGKIEIINNTNIIEVKGEKYITEIILDKAYNGKTNFALDAIFIEIGHIALSDLAHKIGVTVNKKGEIMIDRDAQTNIPGFYAAGDVVDTRFKQAITGVAEGVLAVYSAYTFLTEAEE